MITLRPHTRVIHFPPHTHDYVEVIYMCQGTTTHIVNGQTIRLNAGDLLFLNQSTTHEVCKADYEDIAEAAWYFGTDASKNVTGAELNVDGGMSCQLYPVKLNEWKRIAKEHMDD